MIRLIDKIKTFNQKIKRIKKFTANKGGMLNKKAKGTKAEREIIHLFHKHNWSAIRSAGSGSSRFPSPDILAGNIARKVAVECKSTSSSVLYLPKECVEQLKEFCSNFGAEPWIGVRFKEWYFLTLEDIKETNAGFSVSTKLARQKGLLFEEMIDKN